VAARRPATSMTSDRIGDTVSCPACGERVAGGRFCSHCGRALSPAAASFSVPGERRHLTVVFADVVGSTALALEVGAEDWRGACRAYLAFASETIERFGGHVARFVGDAVLGWFGYPRAYGDDVERAVRAGIALAETVPALDVGLAGRRLSVRVAVHSGFVVVDRDEIFGDVPNVGARLQTLALPDTVVISEAVARLVRDRFVTEPLGSHPLHGVPEPVAVHRVLGVVERGMGGHVAAALAAPPSVGRSRERGLLRGSWEDARDGRGRTVVVTGEPGIGKSELLAAFRRSLSEEPYLWLEARCASYHARAFHPVVQLLETALGLEVGTAPAKRWVELQGALSAAGIAAADADLVAPLFAAASRDIVPPHAGSAEDRRRALLEALAVLLASAAVDVPVVVAVEDLQWADASTLEVLARTSTLARERPVLLLVSTRPEFQGWRAWEPLPTAIALGALPPSEARALVTGIAAGGELSATICDLIVARTDGVPLFIEEVTRLALDADLGDAAAAERIPVSLRDSLHARLDRAGPAREVGQIAAVIGTEFSRAVLRAVADLSPAALDDALEQLVRAGIVSRTEAPAMEAYAFRHALLREAAYDSLLVKRRRAVHGAVAAALRAGGPGLPAAPPELVAHHWTEAGDAGSAVPAWREAAEQAAARSAYPEAESHYRRAIEILAASADAPERLHEQMMLELGRAYALMVLRGYSEPEVAAGFERVRQLGARIDDQEQVVFALLGAWIVNVSRGELIVATELAAQLAAAADREGSRFGLAWGHYARAATWYCRGDFVAAEPHVAAALTCGDEVAHRQAGFGPGVAVLCTASHLAWQRGRTADARRQLQDAEELAARLGFAHDRALALGFACGLYFFLRETDGVEASSAALLALGREENNPQFVAQGVIFRGWARAEKGDARGGADEIRRGIDLFLGTGQRLGYAVFLAMLAEAETRAGSLDEAFATVESALRVVPEEECYQSYLLRLRGELLARRGDAAALVERCFGEAIAIARRQGSLAYERRATEALGEWLAERGRDPLPAGRVDSGGESPRG
jgi:class 3 adenylate cyclase